MGRLAFVCALACSAFAGEARFEPRDGPAIAGEILGPRDVRLETAWGPLRVPVRDLAALERGDGHDVVRTRRGHVRGRVVTEAWSVRTAFGVVEIATATLASARFGRPAPAPRDDRWVRLAGTRLAGRLLPADLRLETRYGDLRIPFGAIDRLRRDGATVVVRARGMKIRGTLRDPRFVLATPYGRLGLDAAELLGIDTRRAPAVGASLGGDRTVAAVETFRGHTYVLIRSATGIAWADALSLAKELDGHVVTIGNAEENGFVARLAQRCGDTCWIGLTDLDREGDWRWVTGEPAQFFAWDPGEPNNAGEEDLAEMYVDARSPRWNDVSAASRKRSLILELDR